MSRASLASLIAALALGFGACTQGTEGGAEADSLGHSLDVSGPQEEVGPGGDERSRLHASDATSGEGEVDAPVATDAEHMGPDATLCPPNREGEACQECSGGWTGEGCNECPANWSGEMCDLCSGGWTGEGCDECPANWSGEMCDLCSGGWTGEACDECPANWSGEMCDVCADAFIGEACDECADPTFTGEACDECADPTFSGVNCDETFRQLWPLSTARSTSNRPVFRVKLAPETVEGARITICAEVSCETVLLSFDIPGSSGPCPEPLPAGPIYWYAEGLQGGEVVSASSSVWQLHIPAYPAPHASAWGSTFDLELDGMADVLVGSCALSGCTELVGIHAGSVEGPSVTPSVLLTDPMAATSFGFSVSSAGDVNGDGLPDVIVGAGLGDSAHVFLNSPEGILPEPVQSWQVPGAWFGFSVASAGDVNGDGYGDVIVGSMLGFSAFLYYGGPEGPGEGPSASISTGAFGFGVSVSSAGDVNGDGYEDLICGAANAMPPEASLWLGGPEGPQASASQVLTGEGTFGISTRGAGDINGDGYADVVIGNPDPSSQLFVAHYGSPEGLSEEPSFSATGPLNFGLSVAGAGDLNGDGYGDVVISAKDMAWVYHGAQGGLSGEAAIVLQGPAASQFGDSVAALGDTNGDGFDDLGVGAPGGSRAYTFLGGAEGLSAEWDVEMYHDAVGDDLQEVDGYGFTLGHSVR